MTGSPQWQAKVLAKRRAGAYTVLTVSAPGLAELCRPGHYASVAIGGGSGSTTALLLRRQLWIGEVSGSGRDGGSLELVADPAERGGRWLAGLEQGAAVTAVDVIAPLGRPFALPRDPVNATLVAVGSASAALIPLAGRLVERGCRVRFVLAGEAYGLLEARRVAAAVVQAEPGAGMSGVLGSALDADTDVVYSAGAAPALREVAAAAARRGLPHQAAVAAELVCGAGTCTACAVPVTGRDGITRVVRSCVEGPVFDADLVHWDALALAPADSGAVLDVGAAS